MQLRVERKVKMCLTWKKKISYISWVHVFVIKADVGVAVAVTDLLSVLQHWICPSVCLLFTPVELNYNLKFLTLFSSSFHCMCLSVSQRLWSLFFHIVACLLSLKAITTPNNNKLFTFTLCSIINFWAECCVVVCLV